MCEWDQLNSRFSRSSRKFNPALVLSWGCPCVREKWIRLQLFWNDVQCKYFAFATFAFVTGRYSFFIFLFVSEFFLCVFHFSYFSKNIPWIKRKNEADCKFLEMNWTDVFRFRDRKVFGKKEINQTASISLSLEKFSLWICRVLSVFNFIAAEIIHIPPSL